MTSRKKNVNHSRDKKRLSFFLNGRNIKAQQLLHGQAQNETKNEDI
jgi:hypothetical protein